MEKIEVRHDEMTGNYDRSVDRERGKRRDEGRELRVMRRRVVWWSSELEILRRETRTEKRKEI